MTSTDFTCETCEYFNASQSVVRGEGQCRRHPPKVFVVSNSIMTIFPSVSTADWCGEYSKPLSGL